MAETPSSIPVSTRLLRIATLARQAPTCFVGGYVTDLHHVANPHPEEPDAGIPHVRIRGGPGMVTSPVYPTHAHSARPPPADTRKRWKGRTVEPGVA
jgi:hypothetical protein